MLFLPCFCSYEAPLTPTTQPNAPFLLFQSDPIVDNLVSQLTQKDLDVTYSVSCVLCHHSLTIEFLQIYKFNGDAILVGAEIQGGHNNYRAKFGS